jgi:hypothetical protein
VKLTPPPGQPRDENPRGTAALILGVASFLPIPGLLAGIVAIVLGATSRTVGANGRLCRTSAGWTGLILGSLSVSLFLAAGIVYFAVLGYPFPHPQRYHPAH